MQAVEYYQIGGFRAHWRGNSNDDAASRLVQTGAELVLGIRPNGASALLLPSVRFFTLNLPGRPQGRPWRASEFESLSPIEFASARALADRLRDLANNKSNKGRGGAIDRSKANKQYSLGGEGRSPEGAARAGFEHQRVLYRMYQEALTDRVYYALAPAPWLKDVRIVSFAFNLWASDLRSLPEREADPRVLDIGWTEFNVPTDEDDLKPSSTTHLVVEEDRLLGNPGRARLNMPGITKPLPRAEISNVLQSLFVQHNEANRSNPILLFVYGERMARCVLRSFGIDMSRWEVGIKTLLYHPATASAPGPWDRDGRGARENGWGRGRSRSPTRRQDTYGRTSSRPRSPPARHPPPPVYLVDIREMHNRVMYAARDEDTLLETAKALGVKDEVPGSDGDVTYEDIDPKSWCAGKESRILGLSWQSMALGDAIDQQLTVRQRFSNEDAAMQAQGLPEPGGDDDDFDPNDPVQPPAHPGNPVPPAQPSGLYDSGDDSDYW